MKRIPKDTAFTVWTAKLLSRRIQRNPHRRTIEILNGLDIASQAEPESYFVPGSYLYVLHGNTALTRGCYEIS